MLFCAESFIINITGVNGISITVTNQECDECDECDEFHISQERALVNPL